MPYHESTQRSKAVLVPPEADANQYNSHAG